MEIIHAIVDTVVTIVPKKVYLGLVITFIVVCLVGIAYFILG